MIKKWTLVSRTDVSPSPWFPIENRVYQLPNSKIINDFTVSPIANVSMIIPITTDHKVVLVRQYKPGIDDIVLEFPGGRLDQRHPDHDSLAQAELEEELGIKVSQDQLHQFGKFVGFSTKSSEICYFYLATNCEFNSQSQFDDTEDIEPIVVTFEELDAMIQSNEFYNAISVAGWTLAKTKFPTLFKNHTLDTINP